MYVAFYRSFHLPYCGSFELIAEGFKLIELRESAIKKLFQKVFIIIILHQNNLKYLPVFTASRKKLSQLIFEFIFSLFDSNLKLTEFAFDFNDIFYIRNQVSDFFKL
jgi:hypothetical protein